MVAGTPRRRLPVTVKRAVVPTWRGIAVQLARDGGRRPPETDGNLTETLAVAVEVADLDPLVLG